MINCFCIQICLSKYFRYSVCVCVCALQVTRSLLDDFYFFLIKTLRELCDEPMAVFPNITRTFDNCAPPIMTTTIYRGSIILTYTHYILLGYHGFVLIFKGGHKFYNISGILSLLWRM